MYLIDTVMKEHLPKNIYRKCLKLAMEGKHDLILADADVIANARYERAGLLKKELHIIATGSSL